MCSTFVEIVNKFFEIVNFDQKQCQIDIAQELLNEVNSDPRLLKRAINSNETWVYGYDVETKAQSSQYIHPEESRPKKFYRSNFKFVQMSRFFSLFSWILTAYCTMSSCHKVVHSLNSTTWKFYWKFYDVCVKQSEEIVQIFVMTKQRIIISPRQRTCSQFTACLWIFGQKQHYQHPSVPVFGGHSPLKLLSNFKYGRTTFCQP